MSILEGDLILDLFIIGLGIMAILNGRRFYWLFVGLGGAVVGLWLSAWLLPNQNDWIYVLVTLIFGLVGVWFAFRFSKPALHFAAFVLGGFILEFLLLDAGFIELRGFGDFAAVLVGGLVGLAFELYYSNRSLIVFSSFAGAAMVASILDVSPAMDAALFSGLAAVGMLLQSREWIQPVNDASVKPAQVNAPPSTMSNDLS